MRDQRGQGRGGAGWPPWGCLGGQRGPHGCERPRQWWGTQRGVGEGRGPPALPCTGRPSGDTSPPSPGRSRPLNGDDGASPHRPPGSWRREASADQMCSYSEKIFKFNALNQQGRWFCSWFCYRPCFILRNEPGAIRCWEHTRASSGRPHPGGPGWQEVDVGADVRLEAGPTGLHVGPSGAPLRPGRGDLRGRGVGIEGSRSVPCPGQAG